MLMKQYTQSAEFYEIPEEAYRFAEDYQVGFPLHLYNMLPKALSIYKWILIITIGTTILSFAAGFVGFFIFLYRLITLPSEQFSASLDSISFILPWLFGLLFSVKAIALKWIYKRDLPISVLVCSEGLLVIRPRGVEVTQWSEVNGIHRVSSDWERKRYMLSRVKRKALFFGEALENLEDLKDRIEQHIKKRNMKE